MPNSAQIITTCLISFKRWDHQYAYFSILPCWLWKLSEDLLGCMQSLRIAIFIRILDTHTHSIFRPWQKRTINLEKSIRLQYKSKQQLSREAHHFLFWGLQLGRGFGFSSGFNKLCWLDHALRVQSLAHLEHGPSCPYSVPCGIKPFIRDLRCRFSVPAMKSTSHVNQLWRIW